MTEEAAGRPSPRRAMTPITDPQRPGPRWPPSRRRGPRWPASGPADPGGDGRGSVPLRIRRRAGVARRCMLMAAAVLAMAPLATAANAPAQRADRGGGRPSAGTRVGAPPDMPAAPTSALDLRAMLLLLEERRSYEPVTVLEALKGGPALRADLAVALGRAQDREGRA